MRVAKVYHSLLDRIVSLLPPHLVHHLCLIPWSTINKHCTHKVKVTSQPCHKQHQSLLQQRIRKSSHLLLFLITLYLLGPGIILQPNQCLLDSSINLDSSYLLDSSSFPSSVSLTEFFKLYRYASSWFRASTLSSSAASASANSSASWITKGYKQLASHHRVVFSLHYNFVPAMCTS